MDDTIDELQIKIDKARMTLPEETKRAIEAVDWKSAILGMRLSRGYSFEQLGDLETETELLLCGLLSPEDYAKELGARMGLTKERANELVEEMNKLVFSKIREEMIKNSERDKAKIQATDTNVRAELKPVESVSSTEINTHEREVLGNAGIKIITPDWSKLEITAPSKPIPPPASNVPEIPIAPSSPLAQKLSDSFKTTAVKTEHSLGNISKSAAAYPPKADPYRLSPED